MKETFLVVGAGGTGGYFIKSLLHYLSTLNSSSQYNVLVVDGDVVESKNLLRQAFYSHDIGKYKAQVFKDRFTNSEGILPPNVQIDNINGFIQSPLEVIEKLSDEQYADSDTFTLVSCVDNNLARLRMTIATYLVREKFNKEVRFLDSGNSLWEGQTLTKVLKSNNTYLNGLLKALESETPNDFMNFKLNKNSQANILYSQFTENPNWIESLTKGEHELSCDEVTVSNPQNIATNQTASMVLMLALSKVQSNTYVGEIKFDSSKNMVYQVPNTHEIKEETEYKERLTEILNYIKTKEGFKDVFSSDLLVDDFVAETPNTVTEDEKDVLSVNTSNVTNDVEEVEESIVQVLGSVTEPLNDFKNEYTSNSESSLVKNSKEVIDLDLDLQLDSMLKSTTESSAIDKELEKLFQ